MNEQFTITRAPVTPEYVLEVLRDSYRQQCQFDPEAERDIELSFDTTVAEWRIACDLLPWHGIADAFNVAWRLHCSREQWKAVLEPAKRRTLRDVCTLLAKHAEFPQARPVTVLGSSCLSAGVFFTIRSLLREAGADAAEIAPSTPLEPYTRRYVQVFLSPISQLAPGTLPPVKIHHPLYDAAVWGFLAALALTVIGLCSASVMGMTTGSFLSIVSLAMIAAGPLLAVASYTMIGVAARRGPSRVEFGNLKTFRDLVTALEETDHPTQGLCYERKN